MNAATKIAFPRARRERGTGCHDERGSALFVVLILALVMAGMLASVLSYLNSEAQLEKRSDVRLESTYAAEFAFEKAFTDLKAQIAQYNLPNIAQTTAVTNLTLAPSDQFGTAQGYTWKTFLTVPVEDGVVVDKHTGFNAVRGSYHYVSAIEFQRQTPGMTAPVQMSFQREWIYSIKPLFQYAIFYDSDMELFPGAKFVVGGRVHSNGTIYTNTAASITYSDYVTYVNGISKDYAPNDKHHKDVLTGPVTYAKGHPTASSREDPPGSMAKDTDDSNVNNDGARELIEIPDTHQNDPSASERLYNQAGLKVLVNTTGATASSASNVSVGSKSRVYMTEDGTIIPAGDPLATVLNTMISNPATKKTVTDYRENSAAVTVTEVNVAALTTAYEAGGLPATIPSTAKWPDDSSVPAALKNQDIPSDLRGKKLWNGVLYVANVTDSTTNPVAVKIINGTDLPDGSKPLSTKAGLTIVSENPAYIVGDYNTGGNSPAVNDGDKALDSKNYVAGYTVQPAAVIADAVTVLSRYWDSDDYNNKATLSSRKPTNTTINTALISGIVKTTTSAYSGGVENYIRLLEDWGGKRLTYYGSIINLYESQQATAPWAGSAYGVPTRNWYFDTQFSDPSKLPPGTPTVRSLQRGQWVQLQ
ncbi:hypothetical protein [Opitutus terrae]|uniref:Type 4 fimbrial biogenesis protein PilX N-terminal domain-containing protein n=1 Tax=Opitutus terrae (strain DSM 11246 / JCM 15787 / PB90-1) TaxID=452637 RepID=B1ZWP8_OPITP|nr:hypothetical protein [Opitutus terrae]ACB74175.1 hypothetical protein Oter_0887 [Opitutus terrae PB90-1]